MRGVTTLTGRTTRIVGAAGSEWSRCCRTCNPWSVTGQEMVVSPSEVVGGLPRVQPSVSESPRLKAPGEAFA